MHRICLGLITAILVALAPPLHADGGTISAAQDAKRKINLAGRQRMLTQRIAKSACLAQMGVNAAKNRTETAEAVETFDRVLVAIRLGSPDLGMLEETDPDVLRELSLTRQRWNRFEVNARASSRADLPKAAFAALRTENVALLTQMNETVQALQVAKGTASMSPDLALLINVSGRQRMLTQKTVKDLCMIVSGIDPVADRVALKESVAEFEGSLRDLIEGNQSRDILPAPTWDIEAQLVYVSTLWAEIAPDLDLAINGADPAPKMLARIAEKSETILSEMNNAVWMYENL